MTAPKSGDGQSPRAAETGTDLPSVEVPSVDVAAGVGPGLPGWWLRLALGLVSGASVLLGLQVGAGTGVLTVLGFMLVGLAFATVIAPQSIAATLLILGAMTTHLLGRDDGVSLLTGVLAGLLLAVHQLAGMCAAIPPRSIVHPGALRPALLRFVLCAGVVLIGVVATVLA